MLSGWIRSLKAKISSAAVGNAISRLPATERDKCKLVMTLLVRDEEDIVRQNIEFHLKQGVDFIIATDNGSVDATLDILRSYERESVLYLIEEPTQDHSQSKWVNRMGEIAYVKYGADFIFHCDADEFWEASSGNLKNEMIVRKNLDVMKVNVINMLLKDLNGAETFPRDTVYAVTKPLKKENLKEKSKVESLYLLRYPPSVMLRTSKGLLNVTEGNHSITAKKGVRIAESLDITIYHFPVRNKEHFFRKVINGGSALENNKALGENVNWHWRRWYEAYKKGELEAEYIKLVLPSSREKQLKCDHIITERTFSF